MLYANFYLGCGIFSVTLAFLTMQKENYTLVYHIRSATTLFDTMDPFSSGGISNALRRPLVAAEALSQL